jgi:sortase A
VTVLDDRPDLVDAPVAVGAPSAPEVASTALVAAGPRQDAVSPQRLRLLFLAWLAAIPLAIALVIYGFGPYFHDREQRNRLGDFTAEVGLAVNATSGIPGATAVARAPEPGSTVAILEIGPLRLQEAVVEGVSSANTRSGPGHVPGTAGLGQPGNAVVIGRAHGFGGPFSGLDDLRTGDEIVVTTTQGQSVYEVSTKDHVRLTRPSADGAAFTASAEGSRTIEEVYGPSDGDQLTLVTSASRLPGNDSSAIVVVASMQDHPFPPTPQGGRTDRGTGTQSDQDARAAALLCVILYGMGIGMSVLLYRRLPKRVGYLLTVAPIVALTIITGETISRLFPAWM